MTQEKKQEWEHWKREHDKWYGKFINNPTEHNRKKWERAYDKMNEIKATTLKHSKP